MAKSYRSVDRDQGFLLPPDMREWLPASDPVWLVMEIIEQHLDTSPFHRLRRRGGAGRASYDPDMLLMLLVWGWMQRVSSSRRLERLGSRDVSFRVICAGDVPDHVTIARFRAEFADAVEALFTEVLILCHRLGLGRVELVAVDGTKLAAPASQGANRTAEGLRRAQHAEAEREAARRAAREAARAHAETDAAEDGLLGERLGDEIEDDPGPGSSARSARIAEALADLEAEREAAERVEAARQADRQKREAPGDALLPGRPRAGSEVVLAEQALGGVWVEVEQRRQRWLATGKGRDPAPGGVDQHNRVRRAMARLERARQRTAKREARAAVRVCPAGRMRNITDPQSRLLSVKGGWVQGYNAQAAATADGIVLATAVSNCGADAPAFIPLMQAAVAAAQRMGAEPIGLLLADAGYLSVDNLTAPGPDRLIAVGNRRDLEQATRRETPAAGKSKRAPQIEAMQTRLQTPEAMAAYRRRGPTIETVFGNSKHNWNFTRFTGTGLKRAESDWAFHGLVHNISKIINRLAAQPG